MAEPTDHELLTRFARTGDEAAFAALVQRHVNLVWSAARRFTGDDTLASEVTQAVFIILAQKAGRLSAQTVLTGWLYQTARLTAANALKENRRRQQREHQAYMEATLNRGGDASSPTANESIWQQLAPVLDEAMHALRTADRDAVLLRYFENKSLADVGAALGVTEDAARVRVNRALDKLRALLAKQGIKFGAALLATAVVENSVQAAPKALVAKVSVIAAKGSATTTSITTLVKGTLKIMAWSKAQTVIVVGVGLLLAAGVTTAVVKKSVSFSGNSTYEEIWKHPDSSSMGALESAPATLIIRQTRYPNKGGGIWTTSGKCVYANCDITDLIGFAYQFGPARMILPDGLPGERYDYLNTLPQGSQDNALREQIKKQFGLVAHTETRETDVLLLKVNDSTKLQSHLSKGGPTSNYGTGDKNIQKRIFRNVELSAMASLLEAFYLKPTLDRSGMPRRYSFDIQWNEHIWSSPEVRRVAMQQALLNQLDQLGLELVPSREPIAMLVVKKV